MFRMAQFLLLPQYSPITFIILHLLCKIDHEATILRAAHLYHRTEYIAQTTLSTAYKATYDFITSFIPWLIFVSLTSIFAASGCFFNIMTFWITILPKLWLIVSEHRSVLQIFADPTRRHHLQKWKPSWKRN